MGKYHFIFQTTDGTDIIDYETDLEPPRVGDIVQFNELTNGKDENAYRVHKLWYSPLSEQRVQILFELDLAK